MKTGRVRPITRTVGYHYTIAFRLEPRCRLEEVNEGLRARIHDPLWLLGRQLQFGEFQGEDAAAPVLAEIELVSRQPDRYLLGPGNGDPQTGWLEEGNGSSAPLEAVIEAEPPRWDAYLRARVGSYLEQRLPEELRDRIRAAFPLEKPTEEQLARQSRTARFFFQAMSERVVDAEKLFAQESACGSAAEAYEQETETRLDESDRDALEKAVTKARDWFEGLYYSAGGGAWQHERAEYRASIAAPAQSGQRVMEAREYYDGDLDWYAFRVDGREGTAIEAPLTDPPPPQEPLFTRRSVLPTGVQMPGMPHERFWELEEGNVNLTKIEVEPEHLGKMLMLGFSLVFSNDWFLVPVPLPRGSLTRVSRCIIHDSFGGTPLTLRPVDGSSTAPWTMFALSRQLDDDVMGHDDGLLYLPARTVGRMESKAIEELHFQRDEVGNLVWAIERKVADALGRAADAESLSRGAVEYVLGVHRDATQEAVNAWLVAQETGDRALESRALGAALMAVEAYVERGGQRSDIVNAPTPDEPSPLRYELADFPPRTCFPLAPILRPIEESGPQGLMLQRHAIPDPLLSSKGELIPVRPQGRLLHPEIVPFYMYEEEVPQVGVRLTRSYQYARGRDGKPYLWIGRRKQPGRPERPPGVNFDLLRPGC